MKTFFKVLMLIVAITFSNNVFANNLIDVNQSAVVDIWDEGESQLVLLASGEIIELDSLDTQSLAVVEEAMADNKEISFDRPMNLKFFDNSNTRDRVYNLGIAQTHDFSEQGFFKALGGIRYDSLVRTSSSIVSSPEAANRLFSILPNDHRNRSQCYNRAHVWSYELYRRNRFQSMKTWLFFSRKYIREYNYKWWFHVTTSVQVSNGENVSLMAVDRTFTNGPLTIKQWTDNFMYNNAQCLEVENYSSYKARTNSEYCLLIHTDMYFWQPLNIEKMEQGENAPMTFRSGDMSRAYRNALGRRRGSRAYRP